MSDNNLLKNIKTAKARLSQAQRQIIREKRLHGDFSLAQWQSLLADLLTFDASLNKPKKEQGTSSDIWAGITGALGFVGVLAGLISSSWLVFFAFFVPASLTFMLLSRARSKLKLIADVDLHDNLSGMISALIALLATACGGRAKCTLTADLAQELDETRLYEKIEVAQRNGYPKTISVYPFERLRFRGRLADGTRLQCVLNERVKKLKIGKHPRSKQLDTVRYKYKDKLSQKLNCRLKVSRSIYGDMPIPPGDWQCEIRGDMAVYKISLKQKHECAYARFDFDLLQEAIADLYTALRPHSAVTAA